MKRRPLDPLRLHGSRTLHRAVNCFLSSWCFTGCVEIVHELTATQRCEPSSPQGPGSLCLRL